MRYPEVVKWFLLIRLMPLLPQDPSALVEGTVTIAFSGEPLKKCAVNLPDIEAKTENVFTATSEAEVRFRCPNVGPDRYNLGERKSGFERQELAVKTALRSSAVLGCAASRPLP